jgi:hypothetical protein
MDDKNTIQRFLNLIHSELSAGAGKEEILMFVRRYNPCLTPNAEAVRRSEVKVLCDDRVRQNWHRLTSVAGNERKRTGANFWHALIAEGRNIRDGR